MKTFPFANGRPHRYFQNESRFAGLNHDNVIKVEHAETRKPMIHRGCQVEMSYILMEYAPHGDFFDLVGSCKIKDDNKLVRTYFKQLIEGMNYLHKHGVAHLDLKLDNLLVGEDYTLKIADFDLSYMTGDEEVLARGTKCYRCPEFIRGRCVNFIAADIYSAGIILFILKSGGLMPHSENNLVKGIDFYDLLYTNHSKFWEKHQQFQKGQDVFDPEFKELFLSMTQLNPSERASIEDVKNSKWYNGEVYTNEELREVMQGHMRS
jgi:serine/threonine protein kinase